MLVTQIKPEKEILERISEKTVFVFVCPGCREVYFPQEKVEEFIRSLPADRTTSTNLDYLCNREFVKEYVQGYSSEIGSADAVLVFSCGVGTQVVSSLLENKIVYTGCDTLYLDGFQGLTVLDFNCEQCGECYLNHTGGICPITHCAKGLINGPCGGAKDRKCEANSDADCAWIMVYERLKKLGRLHLLNEILPARDYHRIITESLARKKV